jgi:hypothetical protein
MVFILAYKLPYYLKGYLWAYYRALYFSGLDIKAVLTMGGILPCIAF